MVKRIGIALVLGWLIVGYAGYGSFIAPTSAYGDDGDGDEIMPPEPGEELTCLDGCIATEA